MVTHGAESGDQQRSGHIARPNRNRKKSSIYLAPEDRERIKTILRHTSVRTEAAAIRRALWFTADSFQEPTKHRELLRKFVELYKSFQFLSPRELRDASNLCNDAARL